MMRWIRRFAIPRKPAASWARMSSAPCPSTVPRRCSLRVGRRQRAAPSLAKVTQVGGKKGYSRPTSDFEEAVRTIRNTILLSDFEGRLRSIMITSAAPSEGKSTIAAHLAIANADRGKKTLLVDGDLRRPSLHTKFGLTQGVGLSNVLTGELPWQDAIISVEGRPNLAFLPAGLGSHRAADLIGPRLATLLDEFAKEFDLVFLDAPPLMGFAECLQMATATGRSSDYQPRRGNQAQGSRRGNLHSYQAARQYYWRDLEPGQPEYFVGQLLVLRVLQVRSGSAEVRVVHWGSAGPPDDMRSR